MFTLFTARILSRVKFPRRLLMKCPAVLNLTRWFSITDCIRCTGPRTKFRIRVIYNRMRDLAQSIKKGAPQAKIFYLLTTPHTAETPLPPANRSTRSALRTILSKRLNRISIQVMKDEKHSGHRRLHPR